jgi:hypothetical protein
MGIGALLDLRTEAEGRTALSSSRQYSAARDGDGNRPVIRPGPPGGDMPYFVTNLGFAAVHASSVSARIAA